MVVFSNFSLKLHVSSKQMWVSFLLVDDNSNRVFEFSIINIYQQGKINVDKGYRNISLRKKWIKALEGKTYFVTCLFVNTIIHKDGKAFDS